MFKIFLNNSVCFLAEPQTGFQIAFKMLDADGNEQVEKKEFFKVWASVFKSFSLFMEILHSYHVKSGLDSRIVLHPFCDGVMHMRACPC